MKHWVGVCNWNWINNKKVPVVFETWNGKEKDGKEGKDWSNPRWKREGWMQAICCCTTPQHAHSKYQKQNCLAEFLFEMFLFRFILWNNKQTWANLSMQTFPSHFLRFHNVQWRFLWLNGSLLFHSFHLLCEWFPRAASTAVQHWAWTRQNSTQGINNQTTKKTTTKHIKQTNKFTNKQITIPKEDIKQALHSLLRVRHVLLQDKNRCFKVHTKGCPCTIAVSSH